MVILNFIVVILFLYLLVYSIYLLTLNLKSFKAKDYIEEQERLNDSIKVQNKLCVIVWANKTHEIFEILHALNSQTYSRENYDVHLISICSDKTLTRLPDFAHGARIHTIENPNYFSKDKAISVFVEKILKEEKFDAFVFLGANRMVEADYLENVNKNLKACCVLTGKLDVKADDTTPLTKLFSNILHVKQEFTNHTLNISRTMFDLISIIDGDNCVIPAEILEKVGRVCFETKNDELKYSLFLASNEIKPVYNPFIETTVYAHNFDASSPSTSQKFQLLKYYLPLLFRKRWYFVEYVISMLKPNAIFAFFAYFLILYCSFRFMLSIEVKYVVHLGLFLIFDIILGVVSSKIKFSKLFYLCLYPLCGLILKYKSAVETLAHKNLEKQKMEDASIDMATVQCLVTDGKKDLACELDLVSEDGMRKAVFRYKKKKFFSDAFLRMFDALENITKKVEDKGYVLKICQNCKNFSSNRDETVDLVKGFCSIKRLGEEAGETLIWNTCPGFAKPLKENEVNNKFEK